MTSTRIGELVFLEHFAPLYKIPVPEYLSEPVTQSKLKEKLGKWGAGIVKPDVLAGKRGKAGLVRKVESFQDALRVLRDVAAEEIHGQNPRSAYVVQSVPADLEIFTAISYSSHTLSPRVHCLPPGRHGS